MSKFKFVNIVDIIFISVATFLIIFAWIQFFIKKFILSLVISAILAIGIIMLLKWLKNRKYLANQARINKSSQFALFKLAIQTMPTTKLATLIKKQLPAKYLAKITKGEIHFIKGNTLNTFIFYYENELTELKLLDVIKTHTATNLVVFCSTFKDSVVPITRAFKNKNIQLIDLEHLFEIFNTKNITVDTSNIDLNKHKITIKEILKNSLSRQKSKGYFISGLVLLFTSLIIPYKIYYVVISSILFMLSLACRFKPLPKINSSIFD